MKSKSNGTPNSKGAVISTATLTPASASCYKKTTTVDIRHLILIIILTVALSFGIGVFSATSNKNNLLITAATGNKNNNIGSNSSILSSSSNLTNEIRGQHDTYIATGQHLLVDIKNVESEFLNSEQRLTHALVETVNAAGLTLLSYHCHTLSTLRVSCVGVLLESHISFHTWPKDGVITLDLFTSRGDRPFIPLVTIIERFFGIPRSDLKSDGDDDDDEDEDDGKVIIVWSHELRGFGTDEKYDFPTKTNYLHNLSDLSGWITKQHEPNANKKHIISTTSEYNRIDIWDVKADDSLPSYQDGMKYNWTMEDPRWHISKYRSPNRILFINGAIKVRLPS